MMFWNHQRDAFLLYKICILNINLFITLSSFLYTIRAKATRAAILSLYILFANFFYTKYGSNIKADLLVFVSYLSSAFFAVALFKQEHPE